MTALANSFFVRLAGVLLATVVLLNIFMAFAMLGPTRRDRVDMASMPVPTQAAAIVDVLETTPPEQRERLLTALNSPAVHVAFVDGFPQLRSAARGSRVMSRMLSEYDQAFATHDIHIEMRRARVLERIFNKQARGREWRPYRLYVQLHDGTFVLIEPARSVVIDNFVSRGLGIMAIAGIVVLVGLALAVRQTTRPVTRLAANARTFADRLDAPDLEETGPRELRALAQAFNEMKARIKGLVSERTRFLAAIAHDLRTYLTRLRLRVEFIEDPEQRARAERDLEEMSALLEDTLSFARTVEGKGDPDASTSVSVEIGQMVSSRQEIGEPVSIGAPIDAMLQVRAAPMAVRRILANLIDNAMRYGGVARLYAEAEDGFARLRVEDDGPGIPEEDLERVTAPFERLEASRGRHSGGAGLGLAIVRGMVEAQGGSLKLFNRAGGGVTAQVTLPRA